MIFFASKEKTEDLFYQAMSFMEKRQPKNATDAAKCNIKKLHDYHFHMIANDKIFFMPGKLGAFSDVHSKSDIINMAKSTDKFLTKFKK